MMNTHDSIDLVDAWRDAADPIWSLKRISTAQAYGFAIKGLMRSQNGAVEG